MTDTVLVYAALYQMDVPAVRYNNYANIFL
jgi:hypothetical protein